MGLFNYFKRKENKNTDVIKKADVADDPVQQEFIRDMISNAERIREAYNPIFNNALDYSIHSLKVLDDLLEQFHQNQDDIEEEMKSDIIGQAGGYVFEVARRKYGGKYFWYDQMDQPIMVTGQPDFEISIIAFDKVRKRIENGNEDSIPYYFKGYEEKVVAAKKGDKALLI